MKQVIPVTLVQLDRSKTPPKSFRRYALIIISKLELIEEIQDDDTDDLSEYKAGARTRIETNDVIYTVLEDIVTIHRLIEQ